MYAEKIMEVKFLDRKGTYAYKPLIKTFDADVYLVVGEKITVKSIPPGREDYVLLDYHTVVDATYDMIKLLKSIRYNDVGIEDRYYAHDKFSVPVKIDADVDLGRRLRKLEWVSEEFFESYFLGVEELRKHVDNNLWKYGKAYLVSMPLDDRVPDGVVVRLVSPFDGITRFDVVVIGGKMRARVVGAPVNSVCFLSWLKDHDLKLLFDLYYIKPRRVWVSRLYRKYLRRFIPVVEDYLSRLDARCDCGILGKKKLVKIVVYPYEELYDTSLYFRKILDKKCLYLYGRSCNGGNGERV